MKILTTICTTTEIENLPLKNSALSRGFITQVPLKIKSRGGRGRRGYPKVVTTSGIEWTGVHVNSDINTKKIMYKFSFFFCFWSARQQLNFGQHFSGDVVSSIGLIPHVQVEDYEQVSQIFNHVVDIGGEGSKIWHFWGDAIFEWPLTFETCGHLQKPL